MKPNETERNSMNRRDLFKAVPAAALVSALPAASFAASETPIMALYRQWKAIHVQLNDDDHGLSDDAWDDLHEETWAICSRIMKLPANGGADVLAKIMVFTCDGEHDLPKAEESPQFWVEVQEVMVAPQPA